MESSQLVYIPLLRQFDLAVNRRLKRFICLHCHWVIPKEQLHSHLKNSHRVPPKLLPDLAKLDQALASLQITILPGFPPFPEPGNVVEEYAGLSTTPGLLCNSCEHGYTTLQDLKDHHRHIHPAIPFPANPPDILKQAFSDMPQHKSYFPVSPARVLSKNPGIAAFIKQAREKYLASNLRVPAEERDVRGVDVWLQTNRWHIHLDGYNAQVLSKILDIPKAGEEFDSLHQAVQYTFGSAKESILSTPELIRCKLNSQNLQE